MVHRYRPHLPLCRLREMPQEVVAKLRLVSGGVKWVIKLHRVVEGQEIAKGLISDPPNPPRPIHSECELTCSDGVQCVEVEEHYSHLYYGVCESRGT